MYVKYIKQEIADLKLLLFLSLMLFALSAYADEAKHDVAYFREAAQRFR